MKLENGDFSIGLIFGLLVKPLIPNFVIQKGIDILVARFNALHPNVAKRMQEFSGQIIILELSDVQYSFKVVFSPSFKITIVDSSEHKACVKLTAPINTFLAMLEAKQDGDALFFARKLTIQGDTTAIVALRNILEAEQISIAKDLPDWQVVKFVSNLTKAAALAIDAKLLLLKQSLTKEVQATSGFNSFKLDKHHDLIRELELDLHKTKQKIQSLKEKYAKQFH